MKISYIIEAILYVDELYRMKRNMSKVLDEH